MYKHFHEHKIIPSIEALSSSLPCVSFPTASAPASAIPEDIT